MPAFDLDLAALARGNPHLLPPALLDGPVAYQLATLVVTTCGRETALHNAVLDAAAAVAGPFTCSLANLRATLAACREYAPLRRSRMTLPALLLQPAPACGSRHGRWHRAPLERAEHLAMGRDAYLPRRPREGGKGGSDKAGTTAAVGPQPSHVPVKLVNLIGHVRARQR